MKEKKDRWKPIRRGSIYCSPACGANCTHAMFVKANKKAEALAKKCEKEVGGKWDKRVWENLGWHYCVNLIGGDISIWENGNSKKMYSIMSHGSGSYGAVHVSQHSNSINWLIKNQLRQVSIEAKKWNDYILKNGNALKQSTP